jgi:hypothetical protein
MSPVFGQPTEAPVQYDQYDSDYDPRKPEYIVQVSTQEADSLHAAFLRQQMRGLQSVLHSRKGDLSDSSKDIAILRHYETVLTHLASELSTIALDDDVLAESPVLDERFTKIISLRPLRPFEFDVDSLIASWRLKHQRDDEEACGQKSSGHYAECESSTRDGSSNCDSLSARDSIMTDIDVDTLSPTWQFLEDEEDRENEYGERHLAHFEGDIDSWPLGPCEVDIDIFHKEQKWDDHGINESVDSDRSCARLSILSL